MMFVFQQYTKSIFPWKTVLDNVRLGVKYRNGASRKEQEQLCLEQLDLVGLGRYAHYFPYQTFRRHATACRHRTGVGTTAKNPTDGRAVQRA